LDLWLGKLESTNTLGEQLDRQLEQAEQQAQQLHGGSAALKHGAERVGELGIHVGRDLDEGKLEFESALQASEYVKKKILQAREVLLNLSEKSKNEELVAHGKAAGLRGFMQTMQNHAKAARARAQQLTEQAEEFAKQAEEGNAGGDAEEEGKEEAPRGPRMAGEHPGRSTLAERRAEAGVAKAKAEAAKGNGASESPGADEVETKVAKKTTKKATKKAKKVAKKKVAKRAKQPSNPEGGDGKMPWQGAEG
jgi:hypothetical protein